MIWVAVGAIIVGQVVTMFVVVKSQRDMGDFAEKVGDALLQAIIIRRNLAIQQNEQAIEAILTSEEKIS